VALFQRRRLEDRTEDSRQLVIQYKKFFDTEDGRAVLFDLMNRYRFMDEIPESPHDRLIGAQNVIRYILSKANIKMAEFDKLLKGEF
jgi:hypothetical protein